MTESPDQDFEYFLMAPRRQIPSYLDQCIQEQIHTELDTNLLPVMTKILLMQILAGALTMPFLPQFSFAPSLTHDLLAFFDHHLGNYGTMVASGCVFLGPGALMAGQVLRFAELDFLLKHKYLVCFSLASLIILGFLLLGAQISFSFGLAWILGGSISTILILDMSRVSRLMLLRLMG